MPRKQSSPVINWFFTLNNPTTGELDSLKKFADDQTKRFRAQEEKGARGTRHIQGCFQLKTKQRLQQLKRSLGERYHLEKIKSTIEESWKYCSKEETKVKNGWEYQVGDSPIRRGQRNDLVTIAEGFRGGVPESKLAEQFPSQFIRYSKGAVLRTKGMFTTPLY